MIEIHADTVEQTLVAFVRHWLKLMAADRCQEACGMIDEPNCYGISWTPERIRQVVDDTFSLGCRFRLRHPHGIRWTDPDELGDGGHPEMHLFRDGIGYKFEHDIPLNGEWSNLTAQFEFHNRSQSYAVVLHDVHVL